MSETNYLIKIKYFWDNITELLSDSNQVFSCVYGFNIRENNLGDNHQFDIDEINTSLINSPDEFDPENRKYYNISGSWISFPTTPINEDCFLVDINFKNYEGLAGFFLAILPYNSISYKPFAYIQLNNYFSENKKWNQVLNSSARNVIKIDFSRVVINCILNYNEGFDQNLLKHYHNLVQSYNLNNISDIQFLSSQGFYDKITDLSKLSVTYSSSTSQKQIINADYGTYSYKIPTTLKAIKPKDLFLALNSKLIDARNPGDLLPQYIIYDTYES